MDSHLEANTSPAGCPSLGEPVPSLLLVHNLAWEMVPSRK